MQTCSMECTSPQRYVWAKGAVGHAHCRDDEKDTAHRHVGRVCECNGAVRRALLRLFCSVLFWALARPNEVTSSSRETHSARRESAPARRRCRFCRLPCDLCCRNWRSQLGWQSFCTASPNSLALLNSVGGRCDTRENHKTTAFP